MVWFSPGQNGSAQNYGVIRYTVQSGEAGTYRLGIGVESVYRTLGVGDTDFHVLLNNVVINSFDINAGGAAKCTATLSLSVGDVIDFVVGRGFDGDQYASGLKIAGELCRFH
jgi:hypothetical protein